MTKRRLCCLIVTLILLGHAMQAAAQLPAPNHPILFGYFYADGRYGDFTNEVWDYTDTYVALPCGYDGLAGGCGRHQAFDDSLARAAAAKRKIFLVMDSAETWNWVLDAATPYWSRVKLVEVLSEADLTSEQTEAIVSSLKNKIVIERHLEPKPVGVSYTAEQALTTHGMFAPSLDWVGVEDYLLPSQCVATPDCPNGASCIERMHCRMEQAKARIPSNKQIVLITMAYDRRPGPATDPEGWVGNIPTLTALQDP
ncbi:MAG TPA: hypothetical protein VFV34_24605, partial [Blastocatellia bacterium]|nr:hypothetical protein [Blastocatellia bacterium]